MKQKSHLLNKNFKSPFTINIIMGNAKSNVILPVVANPKEPDVWKVTDNTGYCDIVTNLETAEIAQSYTVPLDGRIKLEEEFEKYQYRRTQNENLVKVYKVMKKNSEYLCSGMDFLNVKTERIPFRLNQIRQLNLAQTVYVLNATLQGYKRINQLIGPVRVDGNMICLTPQGQIKVWLNQNIAKNHPELEHEFDPQIPTEQCQKQMIQLIINTIRAQMKGQQFPPEISQRLSPQKLRSFQTALHLARELSQSLGLSLQKMRIDINNIQTQSVGQSNISNRQSLPPMPPMQVSNIQPQMVQQSQIINSQISQGIQPVMSQLIQGQSQVSQVSIPQSQIQPHMSVVNQTLTQSHIQQQLNNNVVNFVRKSSSSSLRNSEVQDNLVQQIAQPIKIIITGAPESSTIGPRSVMNIPPLPVSVESAFQNPISVAQTGISNNIQYQQTGIPPMNQSVRPSSKSKPPLPASGSRTQIAPTQIAQVINDLRRSSSKQLRRSESRESNQTAKFVNIQRMEQSQTPIGVRAQSPFKNLSNSRVLVGPRIAGPPVSIPPTVSTQPINQNFPNVIAYNPTPLVDNVSVPFFSEKVQSYQKIPLAQRYHTTQRTFVAPSVEQNHIVNRVQSRQRTQVVQRPIMYNQLNSQQQQRIVVKRSVEKVNNFSNNNVSLTAVNTTTNSGNTVVHLMKHHNRIQQPQFEPLSKPNIPMSKPPTGQRQMGRGIGVLNQRMNLNQYKY